MLCDISAVSKAGYYKWLKSLSKPEKDYADYLAIKEVFDKGRGKYGFRTIKMKLDGKTIIMNHKKISRIMNKYNLITKIRRTNPYKAIMRKSLESRTFDNRLARQFNQIEPKKVFCTDITYLSFKYRFVYLSVIKDIASREIVGWHLANHLEMDLVLQTIEDMKSRLSSSLFKNIMIHSDQGFHYTNPLYVEKIKGLNMIQSMSRKGNCIDNSPMESFFGHFKDDVDYKSCTTFEELRSLINEYMRYYNQERQQWNLKKMTPVQYGNHLLNRT